jgi:hypothetical protein
VPNVFDRANISQQLFGKSFQEVQELVAAGRRSSPRPSGRWRRSASTQETVRTAREAESEWRKFGETTGAITGKIKEGFSSIGVVLSLQFAQAANGLTRLLGLQESARSRPVTDRTSTGGGGTWGEEVEQARTAQQEIARIVANGPRIRPVADVDVQVGRSLEQLRDRIRLDETARGSAERLGLVRVGATQQEIAAVRDLLQARDELVKKGATPDQLVEVDRTLRASAASRRDQAAEGQLTTLQQEIRFAGLSAGLVQARIAAEQGVNERIAFRLDFMARERDLMNTLVQQRTSIIDSTLTETDRIGRTLGLIDQMRTRLGPNGLPLLNEQQANRAIGAAFANLNRQLGGPSSFAVNARRLAVSNWRTWWPTWRSGSGTASTIPSDASRRSCRRFSKGRRKATGSTIGGARRPGRSCGNCRRRRPTCERSACVAVTILGLAQRGGLRWTFDGEGNRTFRFLLTLKVTTAPNLLATAAAVYTALNATATSRASRARSTQRPSARR